MTHVQLIASPYLLGHRGVGMGAGPDALLQAGAADRLRTSGRQVGIVVAECETVSHEVGATFQLNRNLAALVRRAVDTRRMPVILAGNCNSCLGALAGAGNGQFGIVWFDAHGDYHTPDTTESGFFDGMALNIATGGSWRAAAASIPGHEPIEPRNVVLVGARDVDEGEAALLDAAGVTVLDPENLRAPGGREKLTDVLEAMGDRVQGVYVHIDLDVLTRERYLVNPFQPNGGLEVDEIVEILHALRAVLPLGVATLAAYDPTVDPGRTTPPAALQVLESLVPSP